MTKTPDPQLPPESAPWGRYVDRSLSELQYKNSKNDQDISNTLKGLGSTIERMSKQIDALNTLTTQLNQQQIILGQQQAAISAQQSTLATQQNYLASLISRDAQADSFNTGTLITDSEFHLVGGQAVIANMAVPTGKVRITISTSEASISGATGLGIIAAITYGIDGVQALDPTGRFARLYSPGISFGSSMSRIGTVTMPPGTYTFRAQSAYWAGGAGTGSIQFTGVRLLVEVINND